MPSTASSTERLERPVRDPDIRRVLHRHLEGQHRDDDTLVLDELGLSCGVARIDVAVLNGSMSGYEIKSDVDSLARLGAQIRGYDAVMDYVTLVAGARLFEHASATVPPHWGLVLAERGDGADVAMHDVRAATMNAGHNPRSLAMMLWRDELVVELKARQAYRGLSRLPKGALWDRMVEVTTTAELRDIVRTRIKARGNWRAELPPLRGGG